MDSDKVAAKNSPFPSLAAPDPQKKGLVELFRKSLVLQEFVQLQSDRSILNLMMLHWSIKRITANFEKYRLIIHKRCEL